MFFTRVSGVVGNICKAELYLSYDEDASSNPLTVHGERNLARVPRFRMWSWPLSTSVGDMLRQVLILIFVCFFFPGLALDRYVILARLKLELLFVFEAITTSSGRVTS